MRVCLINPPRLMKPLSIVLKPAPPLGLAYIAGALRADGAEVCIVDALAEGYETYHGFEDDIVVNGFSVEEIARRIPAGVDLIGLSIMFSGNWPQNRRLIDALGARFPRAVLVAGGEHVSAVPEICLRQTRHLAACVLGEGEETIVELARAIAGRRPLSDIPGIVYRGADGPVRTPRRARMTQPERLARPAWELFPLGRYREKSITYGVDRGTMSLPLLATRGCPYQCTFCSSPQMWGTRYVMRRPQDVADEIEHFAATLEVRNFDFYDLTAIIKKDWILEFCGELIRRDLRITWQIPAGTRSEVIDREVAHALHRSGCRNITYAPEAGSRRVLRAIKKKVDLDRLLSSVSHSVDEGMNVKLNFMMGFPEERHRDVWESIWFLVKASWHGAHDMSPSIFSPYPGSALFDALTRSGQISLDDDRYFHRIIYVDTLFRNHFYNQSVGWMMWRLYLLLYILVFYGSNYLFHPARIVRTISNLLRNRLESRAEMALVDLLKRTKMVVRPAERAIEREPFARGRTPAPW